MRRPTALNLCEAYHRSQPDRICFMRPDSLAFLLNMANLSFQSRVLLVENTKGFLQGALVERAVAYALRVEFYENLTTLGDASTNQMHNTVGGIFPKIPSIREFNFRKSEMKNMGYINASLLMNNTEESTDIVAKQIAKSYAQSFNSCIIVHD